MSRRESYSDTFTGEADSYIRKLLYGEEETDRLKRMLLKIIKNELTPRQKEIIVLYYFREMSVTEIAARENISPQAVSATMARARLRIYKILKYYKN